MPIYKGAKQITKVYQGEIEIDKVYRGASKVYGADKGTEITVSGNPLVLTNVAKEKRLDTLEINGRTEQVQLSGKNLINTKNVVYTKPSDKSSVNTTKRTFTKGTWVNGLANNNYYANAEQIKEAYIEDDYVCVRSLSGYGVAYVTELSGVNTITLSLVDVSDTTYVNAIYISEYGADGTFIRASTGITQTVPSKTIYTAENTEYILVLFVPVYSYGGNTLIKFKAQLEQGKSATPYEQYCGGIPSPSPAYPQEIVNVNSLEVVQSGKNLFDTNDVTYGNWYDSNGVLGTSQSSIMLGKKEVKSNNYTLSWGIIPYSASLVLFDENNVFIRRLHQSILGSFNDKYTFTITDTNAKYMILQVSYYNIYPSCTKEILDGLSLQLEQGTEATSYEPYKPIHTATIDGIELTKWDKIVKRNGVWGVSKWTFKLQRKVSEMNNGENYPGFKNVDGLREAVGVNVNMAYSVPSLINVNVGYAMGINTNNTNAILYLPKTYYDMFESEWKSKYANLDIIAYLHTVQEQAFIPLSQTIQDQLNALQIYKPTTIVSNNAECEMSAKYLCYLDNAEAMLTNLYHDDLSEVLK